MRLTPKEAGFTLYETGFGEDLLDRAASGQALSNLVEQIDDPMVIALDGGWGTGKSWFLKRWVGYHRNAHKGTARTVYFDAFAHDYLDDPLVGLIGTLLEVLGDEEATETQRESLKEAVWKYGPAALRFSTKVGGAVVKNYIGDLGDDVTDIAVEGIEDASTFWARENVRKGAMDQFGDALQTLTLPGDEDGEPRKLVIVVDELDRCRPDYALSLLEVIKHFFAVDHIHFVLGVNLRELENMVQVRYGTREGAELYLQKFVTLTMALPTHRLGQSSNPQAFYKQHFLERSKQLEIATSATDLCRLYLEAIARTRDLSFRDIDRLVANIAVVPWNNEKMKTTYPVFDHFVAVLVFLRVFERGQFSNVCNGNVDAKKLWATFGLADPDGQQEYPQRVIEKTINAMSGLDTSEEGWGRFMPPFGIDDPRSAISGLVRDYLSFNLPPELKGKRKA